jgi:hypothetical protein
MDTTGHRSGVLQCREIGSVDAPELTTRVVPLAALADELPATTRRVSADDRARALDARRVGAQLRSLW